VLSLNARLTLAASLVLVAFLGLTGLALERAYRDAGLAFFNDTATTEIYTLLAAAEVEDGARLRMPRALPEARFSSPDSGLYARVIDSRGRVLWHSPSLLGFDIPFPATRADGVAVFAAADASDGRALYALSFSVRWELGANRDHRFTFQVAESRNILGTRIAHFRRSLWGWLAAAAVALLLVQGLVLRSGLAPLRRVAAELADIESGGRQRLSAHYPRELGKLTERINAFIETGRGRLERSRNALGELAHSLKTPLAVLQSALDANSDREEMRRTLKEQTARMHHTIDYQLQRAAASGPTPLAPAVEIVPLLTRLRDALLKVYADKRLSVEIDADSDIAFHADEGDLVEILGNVLDNACKWAGSRVRVRARYARGDGADLLLHIEDDGPGIPAGKVDAVLTRGVRADASTPGHGIGLAVVREMVVDAYGGEIRVADSELGGAAVEIRMPRR
jgi:two-component system sensor histidine kinase PhoQ